MRDELFDRLFDLLKEPNQFLQGGEKLILEKDSRKLALCHDGETLWVAEVDADEA